MLTFIHTADLHLGKVFHEHPLIEDQQYMLDGLREILEDPSYKALLMAGDVYDRSIPSPDAVTLFSSFLGRLKARRPDLEVLILSGNHDSSSRLGFGKELFAELGIHLATNPEDATTPIIVPGSAGAQGAFFLLPFLTPGSLKADLTAPAPQEGAGQGDAEAGENPAPIRSQGKLAEEAAARLEAARLKAGKAGIDLTILGAHLFALGGLETGSERNFWGTAEQVDINWFSGFDYVALGHLHRHQKTGARAWYSGSPLAYSFEEAAYSKVFLAVTLEQGQEPRINPLPVQPLRKLSVLTGSFTSFFQNPGDSPYAEAAQDYLEVVLTDSTLVENPLARLRERFPWILSVKQEAALARTLVLAHGQSPAFWEGAALKRALIDKDDFKDFLMEIYGEADPEKIELFQELVHAVEAAEQHA
jgi:exonuclease SbcD